MTTLYPLAILTAVLSFPTNVASAQEGDPRVRLPERTEIAGIVQIRGCTPEAAEIQVIAQPMRLGGPGLRTRPVDPRARDVSGRVQDTQDPHTFSFRIRGLQPGEPYHLEVAVPPSPICGHVFWRSDSAGFAVSGGPFIRIDGYAATTELELFDAINDQWVGADHLDFTDSTAGIRSFRWRSNVPGAIDGELQISTARFPTAGDFGACDEPETGIFYRQHVPLIPDDWSRIDAVDFHSIIGRRIVGGDGIPGGAAITPAAYRLLQVGAPLYVRVVPLTELGPACNTGEQGVPGWVIVAKIPGDAPDIAEPPPAPPILEPGLQHRYRPAYSYRGDDGILHPTYDEYAYRAVKEHKLPTQQQCDLSLNFKLLDQGVPVAQLPAFSDYIACQLVRTGELPEGQTVHVGEWFYYKMSFSTGGGSSVLDSVGSLVTAGVGALGVGVNFLADIYNGAVDGVKHLAYDFLLTVPGVGQACDGYSEKCKKAIDVGMTYAMASVGLPPSAPNWDELKQEALDYFAHEIAEQLEEEGVPAALTEFALKQLTQEIIDEMTQNRGSQTNLALSWIERWYGFAPASWSVVVRKNGSESLIGGMVFKTTTTPLFEGAKVPLPKTFPDLPLLDYSFVRLPIVLLPNITDIPAPLCRSSPYTSPRLQCYPSPFATEPVCQYQSPTGPNSPWQSDEGCQKMREMVQIYYRNYWLDHKFLAVPCTSIWGVSFGTAGGGSLYFVVPGLTFIVAGTVPPQTAVTWDGVQGIACTP